MNNLEMARLKAKIRELTEVLEAVQAAVDLPYHLTKRIDAALPALETDRSDEVDFDMKEVAATSRA